MLLRVVVAQEPWAEQVRLVWVVMVVLEPQTAFLARLLLMQVVVAAQATALTASADLEVVAQETQQQTGLREGRILAVVAVVTIMVGSFLVQAAQES
jgi:hypothetical protein